MAHPVLTCLKSLHTVESLSSIRCYFIQISLLADTGTQTWHPANEALFTS